jgi:hypothetical protein
MQANVGTTRRPVNRISRNIEIYHGTLIEFESEGASLQPLCTVARMHDPAINNHLSRLRLRGN